MQVVVKNFLCPCLKYLSPQLKMLLEKQKQQLKAENAIKSLFGVSVVSKKGPKSQNKASKSWNKLGKNIDIAVTGVA
jgi:hypothetical protein